MTENEFKKIWRSGELGSPIFKNGRNIFIAAQGEFATDTGDDIQYIGLYTPLEWRFELPCSAFIVDENTTDEMLNYDWKAYNLRDLNYTGKHCRKI
jgi:hypothetical protein